MKLFGRDGGKLTEEAEEEIEELLDAEPRYPERGRIDTLLVAVDSYLDHVLERFGSDLEGLRLGVD
ncbi:MAG: phosphoglucosamine mutase, partial [Thermoleophilia bacterium]